MRHQILSGLAFLISMVSAHALTQETLDPQKAIEIQISHEDVNRFSLEDGAIVDFVADKNKIHSNLHPTTGSAFVYVSKKQKLEKPVSVSITTGSGEIQTFIVSSREGPGELVILKEDEKKGGLLDTLLTTDYHSSTVELLSKVLNVKAPEGYGIRDVSEMDLTGVKDPLRAKALKAFEGPFETLFLFEIANRSRRPVSIDKNTLKREGDLWIFVPKETILPGETLSCIIATQKEL